MERSTFLRMLRVLLDWSPLPLDRHTEPCALTLHWHLLCHICPPAPLWHTSYGSLLLALKEATLDPVPEPLNLLFPLPGTLFLLLVTQIPCHLLGLRSNIIYSLSLLAAASNTCHRCYALSDYFICALHNLSRPLKSSCVIIPLFIILRLFDYFLYLEISLIKAGSIFIWFTSKYLRLGTQ